MARKLASAELYHPRTGTLHAHRLLTSAREQHTATLLRNGQVLVVGGADHNNAINTANLYNPATGVFTYTGDMALGRVDHTATLLRDGRVLITGGCNGTFFACTIIEASTEIYSPTTGVFTPRAA